MSSIVVAGNVLLAKSGPCSDFSDRGVIFAHTAIGLQLPVAVVQLCHGAASLAAWSYVGFLLASCGTLLLVGSRPPKTLVGILTVAGIALALLVPFAPSTDPYAYALFAYKAFVLHLNPYAPHSLPPDRVGDILNALFPAEQSPIRLANYGPVFVGAYTAFVGPFGLLSLKAMIVAERLCGAASLLICAWLCARLSETGGRIAFAAIALNPLLLLESVSFAHGDAVMIGLLLGALLAYRRNWIAASGILCVLALEVRAVAGAGVLVLLYELASTARFADLGRALRAVAATLLLTGLLAKLIFGTFSLGGLPSIAYDAPMLLLAVALLGVSAGALGAGVVLQALAGAAALFFSIRRRAYEFVPAATLAALPVARAWYFQWLAPVSVFAPDIAVRRAIVAAMLLAPLGEVPEMLDARGQWPWTLIVGLQWSVPLLVYWASRGPRRPPLGRKF